MKGGRAAVYIRYSSENQRDGYSVEYQEDECRKFLSAEGFDVLKVYVDEAQSGRSAEKRTAFFELLSDVRAGLYDAVAVYKFSRFARNLLEATLYRQQIEKHGARLLSAMERIDDATPEGRMMRNIILSMDEYYSENLSTFVMSSMYTAAKKGRYLGGEPPYGYKAEGGGFAVREEEAANVRRAFALRASGMLPADILRAFRSDGIRGRGGKPFTQQLLNKLFRAEKYVGVYECRIKGYDPVRIEGGMPAVVDRETWDAVQAAVSTNASKTRPPKGRTRRNTYPLTGKAFCASCGEPFTGNSKGNGLSYYTCRGQSKLSACSNGSVKKDELESYVFGRIGELILREDLLEDIAAETEARLGEGSEAASASGVRLSGLSDRKHALERQLGSLVDLLLEGTIPKDVLESRVRPLREELETVEGEIAAVSFGASRAVTREGVLSFLRSMAGNLGSADPAVRKALAAAFVDRIEIGPERVEVRLTVNPPPSGDKDNGGWALFTLSPKRRKNRSGWTGIFP